MAPPIPSDSPDNAGRELDLVPRVRSGGCICLSFFARPVRIDSGIAGQRARSSASAFPVDGRGVFLKKSASVVTVFTCFSIASVFSRVSWLLGILAHTSALSLSATHVLE